MANPLEFVRRAVGTQDRANETWHTTMKDISLVANMPPSTNANMTHREICQSPHRLSKHPRTVSLSTGMLEITSLVCSILTTIAITNSFHMTININCYTWAPRSNIQSSDIH